MKIIDNKKDYYDYLSGIYGIDDLIVHDRRHSKILKADGTLPSGIEECFSLATLSKDRPKKAESGFNLQSVHNRIEIEKNDKLFFHRSLKEGRIFHFVLEVGMNQYCFEVERWLEPKDNNKVYLDYWLIKTKYDIKSRFSKSPICMAPCSIHTGFFKLEIEWQNQNIDIDKSISNPILSQTFIPKFIPAEEVWKAVYEYLSSQKEKPIIDKRNDIQKLESAGFDKKTSFRKV